MPRSSATAKLTVKGIDAGTITLAPRIDYIAITPEMGRARLSGGTHYPAEGVQFEAIAYAKSRQRQEGDRTSRWARCRRRSASPRRRRGPTTTT